MTCLLDRFDVPLLTEYLLSFEKTVQKKFGKSALSFPLVNPELDVPRVGNKIKICKKKMVSICLNGSFVSLGKLASSKEYIPFIVNALRLITECISCERWCKELNGKGYCSKCLMYRCLKCPDADCVICQEPLSLFKVFKTKCNHHYHYKCLRRVHTEMIVYDTITEDDGVEYELGDGMRIKKCPMCRAKVNFDTDQSLHI